MAFTSRAARSMGLESNATPDAVAPGAYDLAGQVRLLKKKNTHTHTHTNTNTQGSWPCLVQEDVRSCVYVYA